MIVHQALKPWSVIQNSWNLYFKPFSKYHLVIKLLCWPLYHTRAWKRWKMFDFEHASMVAALVTWKLRFLKPLWCAAFVIDTSSHHKGILWQFPEISACFVHETCLLPRLCGKLSVGSVVGRREPVWRCPLLLRWMNLVWIVQGVRILLCDAFGCVMRNQHSGSATHGWIGIGNRAIW